jgi:hypothetical protein
MWFYARLFSRTNLLNSNSLLSLVSVSRCTSASPERGHIPSPAFSVQTAARFVPNNILLTEKDLMHGMVGEFGQMTFPGCHQLG